MASIPVRSFMDIPNMEHGQRLLLRVNAMRALELPARVVVLIDPTLYLPAKFFVDDQEVGHKLRQMMPPLYKLESFTTEGVRLHQREARHQGELMLRLRKMCHTVMHQLVRTSDVPELVDRGNADRPEEQLIALKQWAELMDRQQAFARSGYVKLSELEEQEPPAHCFTGKLKIKNPRAKERWQVMRLSRDPPHGDAGEDDDEAEEAEDGNDGDGGT